MNPHHRPGAPHETSAERAASGKDGAPPRSRYDRDVSRMDDPNVAQGRTELPRIVAEGPPALVPAGGSFEGQVALVGDTRIEGHVKGSVRGRGQVLIGAAARVDGPLECDALDCRGAIRGPIRASERVRLRAGARIDGDVETPALEVSDSVVWNGHAKVGPARLAKSSEVRVDSGPESNSASSNG